MTERIFTAPDAWVGGSYDLAMQLGARDDARLAHALHAVWTHAALDGVYLEAEREPPEQPRLVVGAVPLDTRLHGVARLGSRAPIACETTVIRYDDGEDWIHLCLPMGSLGRIFEVGAFPFGADSGLSWRSAVDDWLVGIGRRVFAAVPFRLGLVDFDGGELADVDAFARSGVPEARRLGYLVPIDTELRWYPPTG